MSNSSGIRADRRLSGLKQFLKRLEELPRPQTEDSILLRVLVQALVIVGIIATDIAAETTLSLWAVPLSIVGAIWSWKHRRDRNITMKFIIAIGMLGAMALFFHNLLDSLNDTRIVLAELLIDLQVLHSFDLPRRKDLGYSMVIGLILIGVSATLSQTLAFAPFLLVFLAIALPVLVLDYRSRLGLLAQEVLGTRRRKMSLFAADLSWRRLGLLMVVIVALGLGIFAVMPRFPGYKLRSFPVSAPLHYKNLEGRSIFNPAYVKKPKGAGKGIDNGTQQAKDKAPGEMDDTFYYGFDSKINQNLRGALKPKVVLRIRSQSPGFWRVMAFDKYTGQGWEISRNERVQKIFRPGWSNRFYLTVHGAIGKTKEVIQSYTVVSELPNLIPALSYPNSIYFPTEQMSVDTEASLRAPILLTEGLTYSVISDVPYRDVTALQKAQTNYSEPIKRYYLQVPTKIAGKVRQLTQDIIARSAKPLTSPYQKALYLAQYLKQHYSLPQDPLGLPLLAENEDLVEAFLFKYKQGYPDHFSTTLTVMLRSIGIPARLVVGFAPGEFNPFTGLYVVRNVDAYAMTEVYFPNYGWFSFDPIPQHPLIPPSIEKDQTFGVLGQIWKWVAGLLPPPISAWLDRVFAITIGWIAGALVWFFALFSQGWVGLFTGLIIAIGFAFLCWLAWNQFKQWRYRRWLGKLPPMESIYQEMLATLRSQGYPKHPAYTPLEYAQMSRHYQTPASAQIIEEISQAYVSWRYGRQTPNIKQLRQRLQELIKNTQKSAVSNQLARFRNRSRKTAAK